MITCAAPVVGLQKSACTHPCIRNVDAVAHIVQAFTETYGIGIDIEQHRGCKVILSMSMIKAERLLSFSFRSS